MADEVDDHVGGPDVLGVVSRRGRRTPSVASRSVTSERFASEPLTSYPRLASSSAMPLMPIPPMPTKWMRRVRPSMRVVRGSQSQSRTVSRASPGELSACPTIDPGRVGPREPPRRVAIAAAAPGLSSERRDASASTAPVSVVLLDHLRRAGATRTSAFFRW